VITVLAGFPLALALAWAFELGPGGVRKTMDSPADPMGPPAFALSRRNVVVLVGVGAAISVLCGYFLLSHSVASPLDKSIAVLPFDNFSEDKDNEHFADGIHDDVLTLLARIEDLKVISRTSVMQYRGKAHNIREIAQELGVSTVLEGSVRRSGNRVRLVVQLIDALHDRHIWAQEYDRDLTDTFAIQSALAQEIANQLKAKLSTNEVNRIKERPTQMTKLTSSICKLTPCTAGRRKRSTRFGAPNSFTKKPRNWIHPSRSHLLASRTLKAGFITFLIPRRNG
jgi:TolB-like protein